MKLAELIQLNEVAKPILDVSALEATYRTLPPKAKEVMPANIKEWQNFLKQIDNLWMIFDKAKKGISDFVADDFFPDKFRDAVLGGMPYKHSLIEIVNAKSQVLQRLFFMQGLDLSQYYSIREFVYNTTSAQARKSASEKYKSDQNDITETIKNMPEGGEFATPDLDGLLLSQWRLLQRKRPTVVTHTGKDACKLRWDTVQHLNSIPSLKLIKGEIVAWSHTLADLNPNVTVDHAVAWIKTANNYVMPDTPINTFGLTLQLKSNERINLVVKDVGEVLKGLTITKPLKRIELTVLDDNYEKVTPSDTQRKQLQKLSNIPITWV